MMQARRQRQELSAKTSLQLMKTMLLAGFGCIARDRELFPDENFTEKPLVGQDQTATSLLPFSSQASDTKVHTTNMRVPMVVRGHTPEADKLLDYLEKGIFDALERRYLQRFIFAIYLDKDQPTNIIEAYTFIFKYHIIPGTDLAVPVLSIENQMKNMSLGHLTSTDALTLERPATLGEAKKSIKAMLRRLMATVQQFDSLPNQRFATFKIFYTDDTPPDYEPPLFAAGDSEKDKFTFKTHSQEEAPEKHSVGIAHAGHHCVEVKIESIASYLPSSENPDAVYTGVADGQSVGFERQPGPGDVIRRRSEELQRQQDDATLRTHEWNAEEAMHRLGSEEDAEGEEDPDFKQPGTSVNLEERPTTAGARSLHPDNNFPQTEFAASLGSFALDATQVLETQADSASMISSFPSRGVDTLEVKMALAVPSSLSTAIEHREADHLQNHLSSEVEVTGQPAESGAVDCTCAIPESNDGLVYCEGGCNRWYHVWWPWRCMGYTNSKDRKLSAGDFLCLNCRLKKDPNFGLLKGNALYQEVLERFRTLSLFRRSLKSAEQYKPKSFPAFRKFLGGAADVADQMWKRLLSEGFIEPVGDISSRGRQSNAKNKISHKKKLKNPGYQVVEKTFKGAAMKKYFCPDSRAEYKLVGLATGTLTIEDLTVNNDSSDVDKLPEADENPASSSPRPNGKRSHPENHDDTHHRKRVKVSVAKGIDLET